MIKNKTVLAIIPARGGSKGVPRKNIREVAGKPLIAWTIEEAKKSKYIDRLILSSDDSEIIEVARAWGCEVPFVRPSAIARDDTPGIAPVLHAMDCLPAYDWLVLLQPTSPLRKAIDIDGCLELMVGNRVQSCVSVVEVSQHPSWIYTLDANHIMYPYNTQAGEVARRQDLQKLYTLNGAVYVGEYEWYRTNKAFVKADTLAYEMPIERSLDIDTEWDCLVFEALATWSNNGTL